MLSLFLKEAGHQIITATRGGLDVIQAYHQSCPDVVLMDVMMPRINGLTTTHAILSSDPNAKIVLMSGKLHAEHPFITASGASRFLSKPLHLYDLQTVLDELMDGRAVA